MAAIGLLELEVHLPHARSRKDKRRVIRSIKDRARARHNIAIAEVGEVERIRFCHLAVVTVSGARLDAEKRLASVAEIVEQTPEIEVTERRMQWL